MNNPSRSIIAALLLVLVASIGAYVLTRPKSATVAPLTSPSAIAASATPACTASKLYTNPTFHWSVTYCTTTFQLDPQSTDDLVTFDGKTATGDWDAKFGVSLSTEADTEPLSGIVTKKEVDDQTLNAQINGQDAHLTYTTSTTTLGGEPAQIVQESPGVAWNDSFVAVQHAGIALVADGSLGSDEFPATDFGQLLQTLVFNK